MGSSGETVSQAYAAFAKGDIEAIIGMLSDDVDWASPETLPQGGTFKGKDGVLKFFQGVGAAWESLALDIESVDDVGDGRVVGVVRGTGSLRGGGSGEYGAMHLFSIVDGKIARFREYVDIDRAITA